MDSTSEFLGSLSSWSRRPAITTIDDNVLTPFLFRALYERVEPPLRRERLWRQAAERPELRDHMGLVCIP